MIAAIGAVSENGMIGLENWLPWDIPDELAYFERTVAGAALLVGRATYESMDVVPPDTFVLSRQPGLALRPGCHRVDGVEAGLRAAQATGKPVFVIGGAAVYAAAWPWCERFYLTRIGQAYAGDARFPETIPLAEWPVLESRSELLPERPSGRRVECRFLVYQQPAPRRVAG